MKHLESVAEPKRVKFYGPADFASYWQFDRITEVISKFDAAVTPPTIVDAIELHNVQLFIASGMHPGEYSPAERSAADALAPQLRASAFRFFGAINDTNVAAQLTAIPHHYRSDLLDLLARNKAFERCDAQVMLRALADAGLSLVEELGSKKLVSAYDSHIREALIADALRVRLERYHGDRASQLDHVGRESGNQSLCLI